MMGMMKSGMFQDAEWTKAAASFAHYVVAAAFAHYVVAVAFEDLETLDDHHEVELRHERAETLFGDYLHEYLCPWNREWDTYVDIAITSWIRTAPTVRLSAAKAAEDLAFFYTLRPGWELRDGRITRSEQNAEV